jgi:nucleoid DNA-binding protein
MATKKPAKKPAVAKKSAAKKLTKAKAKPTAAAKTKSAAKTKAKVKAPAKKSAALTVKKPFSKSQIVGHLSTVTEVKKKDILAILDGITSIMEAHLEHKGPGEFNFAGLFKCRVVRKPATKARPGTNPFTGLPTVFAAKPARNVLKIRPLKKLKEIVA